MTPDLDDLHQQKQNQLMALLSIGISGLKTNSFEDKNSRNTG